MIFLMRVPSKLMFYSLPFELLNQKKKKQTRRLWWPLINKGRASFVPRAYEFDMPAIS